MQFDAPSRNIDGMINAKAGYLDWHKNLPLSDQDLLQRILHISKLEVAIPTTQEQFINVDTSTCQQDLLQICSEREGVIRALAMHTLRNWVSRHPSRIIACINAGAVPIMLHVLGSCLTAPVASPAAREAASLAVVTLKLLIKGAPEETTSSFIASNGIPQLLSLLGTLHNPRALCLALYLLNVVTRSNPALLGSALQTGGVALLVQLLRRPINEHTKFAALILNRWALTADAVPLMQQEDAEEALFSVLVRRRLTGTTATGAEVEATAYALSAVSILAQHTLDATRSLFLKDSSLLDAVSFAIKDYEQCFHGVGFPHALLCSLLAGPEGADMVAAVLATGLAPTWLAARKVGPRLVHRASKEDAQAAMADLPQHLQLEIAMGLTHLIPYCPSLSSCLTQEQRIQSLITSALHELHSSRGWQCCGEEVQAVDIVPKLSSPPMDMCGPFNCEDSEHEKESTPSPASDGVDSPDTPRLATDPVALSRSGDYSDTLQSCLKRNDSSSSSLPSPGFPELNTPLQQQQQQTSSGGPVPAAAGEQEEQLQRWTSLVRVLRWASEHNKQLRSENKESSDQPEGNQEDGTMTSPHAATAAADAGKQVTHRNKRRCLGPKFCRTDIDSDRYDALTFVVGGKKVKAVGFVLESRSPFLKSLLCMLTDLKENVHVPCVAGLSEERMHALFLLAVEWCYTGEVQHLTVSNAMDLWSVAEFLQIDGLQRCCETVLQTGFVQSWDVVHRSYDLAMRFPTGRALRLAAARFLLESMIAEEGCSADLRMMSNKHNDKLVEDLVEAASEILG